MPIRVRARPQPARDASPVSNRNDYELPDIWHDDTFRQVVRKLSFFFTDAVDLPSTFEQLRTTTAGSCLRLLVDHLSFTCTNPAIVNALLALKWHYAADSEHASLSEARSNACEIVAWRFLARLSERQAVDFCLYEIPDLKEAPTQEQQRQQQQQERGHRVDPESGERAPLLPRLMSSSSTGSTSSHEAVGGSAKKNQLLNSLSRITTMTDDLGTEIDPTAAFVSLNALEIAAIAGAKRFLSQHVVQKIVVGIWNGDIVFWDSLTVHSVKKPHFYNPHTSDAFARLRVPKYLKSWEVIFFTIFLCLYYSVLIVRDEGRISATEIALMLWIVAFAYDELREWLDAGSVFYATDVWNLFDMIMIVIGFTFSILRIIGMAKGSERLNDLAFDILALEALFMIPRICSVLSLSPYWGTLIPCLKEMGKDFIKFMVLVVIVYLGFLTTFSLVGREVFELGKMTGILTKIFFGSSSVGFEVMSDIDPIFGPPLMVIFVTLTSILLTGSMTGILSNSFSRVITHAKEEYLYVYSVYVLEASTSNKVTHFYPPFNLVALVVFRPWRLIFGKDELFRAGRIILLRATHTPIVGAIKLYEMIRQKVFEDEYAGFKGPQANKAWARRAGRAQPRPMSQPRPTSAQSGRLAVAKGARSTSRSRIDEDDVDAPSNVETHIGDLSQKIDQLTTAVLALQEAQLARSAPT